MYISIITPLIIGIGRNPDTYSSQQINLAQCWAEDGHHIDVMTSRGQGLEKALEHECIRLFQLPLFWLGGKGGLPLMMGGRSLLKKNRYDMVFSSEHYQPTTFTACLYSRKVVIYQGHNTTGSTFFRRATFGLLEGIMLPVVRRRYLKVIAKTRSAEAFVRSRGFKKCTTVPCGYDSSRFRLPTPEERRDSKRTLGIDSASKVLVYAGNLLARRDIGTAIRTLSRLQSHGIKTILLVAGEGPEQKHLEQVAEEEQVRASVKFLGHLHWKRLREVYWAGDLFIFPTHYEIFGLVLVEALACGLKLLSTPCPAAEDILSQCPDAGKMATIGDSEAFAEGAKALFPHREIRPDISPSVMNFLRHNDWPSISKRILRAADS